MNTKNKWAAAALNILPGLGYLYVGSRTVFASMLLLVPPLFLLSLVMAPVLTDEQYEVLWEVGYTIWDFLPLILLWVAFIVDAGLEAERHNKTLVKPPRKQQAKRAAISK